MEFGFILNFHKSLTYFLQSLLPTQTNVTAHRKRDEGGGNSKVAKLEPKNRTQGKENGVTKIISHYVERRKEERGVEFFDFERARLMDGGGMGCRESCRTRKEGECDGGMEGNRRC